MSKNGGSIDPRWQLQQLRYQHNNLLNRINNNSYRSPTSSQILQDKKMAARKFNNGDYVKIIRRVDDNIPAGTVGIVRGYDAGYYAVELDPNDVDDRQYLHDCYGILPSGTVGFNFEVSQLEVHIGPLKNHVEFDSVVIAQEKRQQILEALEQIHQRELIFDTWGFNNTVEKGRGVAMLFYGPPGTGKTLMGQAIADKLNAELKIIGTAEVQSSEPGQAERNIKEIFKKARGKNVVLFFDECDSLIYDRTVIGAILSAQVNTLLSCLEKFDGVCIFTTNRIETLDEAVNRRLALKLEFDMPDQAQRAEIWKRMFPAECPLDEDINFMKLATVEIAGGHIKNTVLRAARIAAMEKLTNTEKKIKMAHLVRALREEALSMAAFNKAKKNFNVPAPRGYRSIGLAENNKLTVDTKMIATLGGE